MARKYEGKKAFGNKGIDRRTINMVFKKTGCEDVRWIHRAQNRVQW
jgi:hypothetical protein